MTRSRTKTARKGAARKSLNKGGYGGGGYGGGRYGSVGKTSDGVVILNSKVKPTHFTSAQMRKAIDKII
jgi:hypothetical protein